MRRLWRRFRFLLWDIYGCSGHPDDWPDDYMKFHSRRAVRKL